MVKKVAVKPGKIFWMIYHDSIRGYRLYNVKMDSISERDYIFYILKDGVETIKLTAPKYESEKKYRKELEELFITFEEALVIWTTLFVKDFNKQYGISFDDVVTAYSKVLEKYPENWI